MGGACSTYAGEDGRIKFWVGNLKERDYLRDTAVDGRIIITWGHQALGCGTIDWISLAQERYRLQAPMNAVKKLRVP